MANGMSKLPDELWRGILEIGVERSILGHRDLCSLSISCTLLRSLSDDPSLWSPLLIHDFPSSSSSSLPPNAESPSKSLYKSKFERDRARKRAAWRLAVLNLESQIAECFRKLGNLQSLLAKEHDKWKATAAELANLENARRASVALNVWQPEVVRSSQRKMVEQCTVSIDSRINALQMEIRVCKQQVSVYSKAYNDQKKKITKNKEALASLKYHPVHSLQLEKSANNCSRKRKKLKASNDCHRLPS